MVTAQNSLYVRLWHEVSLASSGLDKYPQRSLAASSGRKWFSYLKGGGFRKWYGNKECVVNWENDGELLQSARHPLENRVWATNFNLEFIFQPNVNWGAISSSEFSARVSGGGELFDAGGSACFPAGISSQIVAGFLNSKVAQAFLQTLNPTLNFQAGNISNLPFITSVATIDSEDIAGNAITIAQSDWDNFETSWDFHDQPMLRPVLKGATLEASWRNWEAQSNAAIRRMQELETENNRLFIAAYGLDGELQPQVSEDQITLARAEVRNDIAAFLSYATGCMMGRYSLDKPGLILANAGDTLENYETEVGKSTDGLTFQPDSDGIIPVLDGEWFEDDIVARTREFLTVTFPESSLGENLRFIEESLGKDIRKYFCSDFYKDHLQTYKKRPIYWQVQSPKKGFACLIYLHRYTKDTLNLVLNNYFRPYLQKLEARLAQLGLDQLNDDLPTRERTAARKEAEKITKVLKECQAWEQDALLPLAQQRIELDLDDGVKVNYLKLQDVLATIPGLAAKED
jgi:hypothetical protein